VDAVGCARPHGAVLGVHPACRGAAAVRAVRRDPRYSANPAGQTGRGGMTDTRIPSRLAVRKRLILFSAPVALILLIAAVKMISVVVAGNSAVANFREGDAD